MTDATSSAAVCPDFDSLSCYADGELSPEAAAGVESHLGDCARCTTLAKRLRTGFEADGGRRGALPPGPGCGEERLVLLATGGLSGAERSDLEAHLHVCDACMAALALLHRRLARASGIAVAVPDSVQRRGHAALAAALPQLADEARPRVIELRGAATLHRIRALLRAPVLVPVALAAGALLMVALQPGSLLRNGDGERSRAVAAPTAKLRVTAVEATVRSRPSMQSEVVGSVHRGALVEIAGEERGWYEVHPDGAKAGWVEREAFE